MSESLTQKLELFAGIIAILAFAGTVAKPLVIAFTDFTTPYLDRFNNKSFLTNLQQKLTDMEHIDFLYGDLRRLTAWCSRIIFCGIVDIVLFVISCFGAMWFLREKIGGDRYSATLA